MNTEIIKEIDVQSVMTKSSLPVGGYSVNPYVGCPHACKYCYASFMKRFTGHTEPWGAFLDVKNWKPIANLHKYDGERIVIGSVTDGYNPYEEQFCRTHRLLEELRGSNAEIMICTKSDLVLRDLDLLKRFPKVTVSWSVNTLDERFRADMDNAVSIERRLKAMRQVYEAGIRTVCFVSPIFPGITDVKAIIEKVKGYADLIWLENLNLRGQFKGGIMTYIREKHPDLFPLYEEIYNKKRLDYWQALEQDIYAVVLTDKERILQIGNNLLSNAIKFTDNGSVSLAADYDNGLLKLIVEDTGTGMTEDEQQRVFSAFERLSNATTKDGFGLGLSIVQRIVTMLGGTIRLESEKGKGSRFTVEIPMQTAEELPEQTIQAQMRHNHICHDVIAIDNDEVLLLMLKEMYAHEGVHCDTCTNVSVLMELIRKKGIQPASDGSEYA